MTARAPRVSVSLILKNATRTLPRLLASLEWKTEPDIPDMLDEDQTTHEGKRRFCFDEIIFVDTGSDDGTYEALAKWLAPDDAALHSALAENAFDYAPGTKVQDLDVVVDGTRFVFARWGWNEHFCDARNFSFELSTADIRGYLDADDWFACDEQGSKARHLRSIMSQALRKTPATAEFSFVYNYDEGTVQKHPRFFVWSRGFTWEGWIHEHCAIVKELDRTPGPRGSYKIHDPGLVINHDKNDVEIVASVERNQRIARAAYEAHADPESDIDINERARMAFHLGEYHRTHDADHVVSANGISGSSIDVAEHFFKEVIDQLAGTNYHADALRNLAEMHLDAGNQTAAVAWAGALAGQFPELLDGPAMLFLAHNAAGHWNRTALLYRESKSRYAELRLRNQGDFTWLTKGLLFAAAARALAEAGDFTEAAEALSMIPRDLSIHPRVRQTFIEANTLTMQKIGLQRLADLSEFLIWDCEASKALTLFDAATPMAIRRLPAVAKLRAGLLERMKHLRGWAEYQEHYASIPASDFDTKKIDHDLYELLVRVQTLITWGESLSKEGPVVRVLSVGFHAGIIEQKLLATNERIHVTVADVAAAQTSQGWAALQERFPGRVSLYEMQDHHYDWGKVEGVYDAAIFFEVIEHVPDDIDALEMLHSLLRVGGALFLSTPISERWVEPYLSASPKEGGPSWWGHVRAYDYLELRDRLWETGYSVAFMLEGADNVFTCKAIKLAESRFPRGLHSLSVARSASGSFDFSATPPTPPQSIGIFVPGTPTPFDAWSIDEGFLGGSEEAVVHLSRELAAMGHIVEVYAPPKVRDTIPRIVADVTYRPVNEFPADNHFGADANHFDAVLFWRCPGALEDPKVRAASYKRILWLHDAYYSVPGRLYTYADVVLTLSESHKRSVIAHDGAPEDAPWRSFANGIVDDAFPPWAPYIPGTNICAACERLDSEHPIVDESGIPLCRETFESGPRDPYNVIYASSPDRGLETLLAIWPEVRNAVPEATLDIYYDWAMIKKHKRAFYDELMQTLDELRSRGVRFHGGVSQPKLHEEMRHAGVWAYPNKGEVETFCITAVKALATGMTPVATAAGALPEVLDRECLPLMKSGDVDCDEFVSALVHALRNPATEGARLAGRQSALSRYSWSVTAKRLVKILLDVKSATR